MKHTFLLFICLTGSIHVYAQDNPASRLSFFDPEHDPIALFADSSILLLESEYTLAQSVQTRLGQGCQVLQITKFHSAEAGVSLQISGIFRHKNRQPFTLHIPLLSDAQGQLFYASTKALICSAPGCNNCSILNGECVGCCSSAKGAAAGLPAPLVKVPSHPHE